MTELLSADTDALGLGRPDHEPLASETIGPIVAYIQTLIDSGHAYAVEGDVFFRVRSDSGLRVAVAPAGRGHGPGRGGRGLRAQGGSARLRAVEGPQGGRGHLVGGSLGARAARAGTSSARRWPRTRSASASTSTAAARTCCFPTTRTRPPRPAPRAGTELARIWMHNGMIQIDRREDGQVGRQHRARCTRCSDSTGATPSSCT